MSRCVLRYRIYLTSQPQTVRAIPGVVIDVEAAKLGVGPAATYVLDLWIDGEDRVVERTFQVVGTGEPISEGARYCGSTAKVGGYKWHVYEVEG
jgi:hypothetical protein